MGRRLKRHIEESDSELRAFIARMAKVIHGPVTVYKPGHPKFNEIAAQRCIGESRGKTPFYRPFDR